MCMWSKSQDREQYQLNDKTRPQVYFVKLPKPATAIGLANQLAWSSKMLNFVKKYCFDKSVKPSYNPQQQTYL